MKLYDPKCKELAEYFLAAWETQGMRAVVTDEMADELANEIQTRVEDWLTVKGADFEIDLHSCGTFVCKDVVGDMVVASSLPAIKEAIAARVGKQALNIRIVKVEPRNRYYRGDDEEGPIKDQMELTFGTITGIHSRNRNPLVRWDGPIDSENGGGGGKSEQLTYYHRDSLFVAEADLEEYFRLLEAQRVANHAVDAFKKNNKPNWSGTGGEEE
jgi:hypothetical protein